MIQALRMFFSAEGTRPWVVVACLMAAGVAEGFGIATMLPLLTMAQGQGSGTGPLGALFEPLVRDLSYEAGLGVLLAIVLLGIALKVALSMLAMRYVGYSVAEVSARLRTRIISQLLAVRWDYLVQHPTGRFIHAVSAQAGAMVEAFRNAAALVAVGIQTTMLLLVAFVVSWQIAVAALVVAAFLGLVLRTFVDRSRQAGKTSSRRSRELVTFLAETMNNIKPVKAMARHAGFERLFEKKIRSLRKAARKQVMSKEALKNLEEVIISLFLAAGAFIALVVMKEQVADIIVVGVLLSRTVKSVAKIQEQYQVVAALEGNFEEVQALLEETAAAKERHDGTAAPDFERAVRLERVWFGYERQPVLEDVTLEVPFGKVAVITGASGAGKTTFIDLVLGLNRPQRGRVLVDDVPLDDIDVKAWRGQVGYVAQELVLLNDTVAANVTLGQPGIGEEAVREALELAGAAGFVAALPEGLRTVVGDKGAALSGGQRQRIALARALVTKPRLLLLDEVTSALDPETEREICANIRGLAGRTTVLAVTHRPAFLDFADVVYHLEDRRVGQRAPGHAPATAPVMQPA